MDGQCIPNWLKKRANLTPDRMALYFSGESYTFKELYIESLNAAAKIAGLKIDTGGYIAVLLRNHPDTVFILLALQMLGIKTVILNNRLSAQELSWQIGDSCAAAVITEESFSSTAVEITKKMDETAVITKEQLFERQDGQAQIVDEFSLADVCTIMYTSGTTGHPKGVLQTYGNHWWSAIGSALNLGLMDKDCWLCAVPLFHISGYSILIRSIIYGIPIVLHEKFVAKRVLHDIAKFNVTIMSVVSVMLVNLIDGLNEHALPASFRCMLLGGGPAPLPLLEKCRKKSIPVYQTYGMTETASQIVTLSPDYSLTKLGSAGKPLFLSQLKIVNFLGNEAGSKEEGEIFVKGPNVTPGYLHHDTVIDHNFGEGWLSTGDIGFLDDEGFLYVLDRRSDLIISGGENIYPAEIEGILLSHFEVSDAGVIGINDSKWGQVPAAFVVRKSGSEVTEDDLAAYCKQKLAGYKVPKQINFVDELPRNAANKLLRRDLPKLVRKGNERD
ncbi:o-succinylbenzoate--CoA ligase [Bacillus canaveralius]|uniref:2-succinylbenzoate--CoA ligase n=1 Tax=Bacillus canaveralius TaxID=1403243 RepID=A0A2N5GPG2_9BACI|nr:o-succinylbenzoate--CoA ligase [Bacillus canaveralius]PLR87046.1 o-succinylbenzoate--CoA ligase [Bacillus sp. V33-4]PLS00620.1 o-succinylbenzoate--CoA ligase [Bacillus canaveralius]RSK57916.1 o-succinylbenzoate--CoA ligase [Bacillus canaveralius]